MAAHGTPLTQSDERALKALLAWWEEAGIELDTPIVRPKPPRPGAMETAVGNASNAYEPTAQRRPDTASPPQSERRTAMAGAARAAGFGAQSASGPSSRDAAVHARSLDELKSIMAKFEGCALKHTARNLVFARGNPEARIMIMGEAPGREEDEQGMPFVGPSGDLLEKMLAAIGLSENDVYLSNIVTWRPPGNRSPTQDEIATCLPFAERHIALKKPDILILAGGVPAQSLLRSSTGITRLRGRWTDYAVRNPAGDPEGQPIATLPVFHPSYLLRRPADKRLAWQDLLEIQARLEHGSTT